jgi:hypothetical protein
MGRGLARILVAVLVVAGMAGCSGPGSVPIKIQNATTVPVGLYLNGDWLGTYPPGANATVPVDPTVPSPWTVELRSPSDAVLLRLRANEDALQAARDGRYGVGESVGRPCGVLTALVGTVNADEALAPTRASISPGPCP